MSTKDTLELFKQLLEMIKMNKQYAELLEKRIKLLEKYKEKLLNSSPQDSIVKMVKTNYLIVKNDNFIKKLDTNPFLIHFNNGVYDLNELQFRKGRRDDLLTYSTNINYTKYEQDSYEIKLIERYRHNIKGIEE